MKLFDKTIGRKVWAVVGGRMPLDQTGPEPEFSSHDSLAILNASGEDAEVEVTIFYADKEPVGPYELEVKARRTREVRFNDLIDPEALPLETNYSAIV
ncbi:MAG: sensory rhodopsin transducer, partial [Bradymonadaceae bacterium]